MAGEVVWDECLTKIATAIKGLTLTAVTDARIVTMLVGDTQSGSGPDVSGYPCVIVFPGAPEFDDGGTNLRDDWTYPVAVAVVSQESGAENPQQTNRARNLLWRERIRKLFHQKRLPGGVTNGDAWRCICRPGAVADRPRWLNVEHAQLLMVNVTVREPRE